MKCTYINVYKYTYTEEIIKKKKKKVLSRLNITYLYYI